MSATVSETIYEIINPSDHCTLKSASFADAVCACLLIGDGHYGLNPTEGHGEEMPIFIFGGSQKWFVEKFATDLEQYFDTHTAQIADVLDTVITGDRHEFEIGYRHASDKEAFRSEWEDKHRTSMNAIERRARKYAVALRANAAKAA